MLFIISTFLELNDDVIEFFKNYEQNSTDEMLLVFSTPDPNVIKLSRSFKSSIGACVPDTSYAEGWNNALKLLKASYKVTAADYLCFMGEGDKILDCPARLPFEAKTILCGTTVRDPDKEVKSEVKSRLVKSFLWLRVGGWTPSFLFPAKELEKFEFDPKLGFAADVEVFFYLIRVRDVAVKRYSSWIIGMESGGLSSNQNNDMYGEVVKKYYLFRWVIFGRIIRNISRLLLH